MKNVTENNLTTIEMEEETSNIFAYDKYIAVLQKNTLTQYNASGKVESNLTLDINNPMVAKSNRFLLVAEKNGKKIYLVSGNKIIWNAELEGNISRMTVNKNGYVAVVLSGTSYKSVIQAFDMAGKQLFKTYLSSTTAMDVAISGDNKEVSFMEVATSGTMIQTMIKTISVEKAKQQPSEAIINTYEANSNSLGLNIQYQEANRLVCRYDDAIHVIKDGKDEKIMSLQENNQTINIADNHLENSVYRMIEKTVILSTQTTVEIMNTDNKKTSNYVVDASVKAAYSYENAIAINLGSEIHFISNNGWLIKKYTSSQEIKNIVIASGFAGIVYRDKIEIINL